MKIRQKLELPRMEAIVEFTPKSYRCTQNDKKAQRISVKIWHKSLLKLAEHS